MNFSIASKKTYKIICLCLCILALQVFLVGCSGENNNNGIDAPDGTVGVTNDAIHFTVCYPQSWICARNDGMVSVSPAGDKSKATVSVHESSAMAEAVSPADHWSKSKEELEKSGNKCTFIESKETKLGGENAVLTVYGMEVGGTVYKVTQVFAYKYIDSSHRMFTVTFTGTEEDYSNSDISSAFKTVVDTFAFKN